MKLSAWSLWLSSSLLLLAHGALAQTSADSARYLTDDELKNPEFVVNWLKTKSAGADRKMADWYFKNGMKDMQRKYCSGASKNFAESMIRYPSPQTLIASADATICMLGAIRARTKSVEQHKQSDLKSVDGFYRSALAADDVLNTLSAAEKTQVRQNADCLSAFVKSGEVQKNCPPLQAYGLNK